MLVYPALVPGTLIKRYKRFLADVRLDDGREVVAHCPNTGSMKAVNVPGCRVWLSPSDNPKRKLAWTWEFIELPQAGGQVALASVHTGRANRIVEAALEAGALAPLAGYATLRREVKVADARLDFRLDDPERGRAYIEVKQVTLKEQDGHGYFPDSVSVRGTKHLHSLRVLAEQGERAVLLFCVAHEGIADVAAAAHIDATYAAALAEASASGVEVLAYGIEVVREQERPTEVRLTRSLPVRL
ncbi:DNA/RNA nuclease SfsA [Halomonas sp. QX-2]|jgi:sugar fermentation stimulation protein A|uniref:Sugar fermentation stimulation protein homolog n=1 Tax=Vreelandella sedimenti TaxID=2729618 RepID=A0A7Z0SLJ1_9GAMM|nr:MULTISPECIES: DNA/RNA nuclease SfsA [Halomonas]NYT71213.1 DNA/RNA nuclease SfsA [Halomonas sedimenti]|tara:strand:- start:8505 stop:9233 length:729 start_codon:yes stop_codon:yes gene_type:complete